MFLCSKNYGSPIRATRLKVAPNIADPITKTYCSLKLICDITSKKSFQTTQGSHYNSNFGKKQNSCYLEADFVYFFLFVCCLFGWFFVLYFKLSLHLPSFKVRGCKWQIYSPFCYLLITPKQSEDYPELKPRMFVCLFVCFFVFCFELSLHIPSFKVRGCKWQILHSVLLFIDQSKIE